MGSGGNWWCIFGEPHCLQIVTEGIKEMDSDQDICNIHILHPSIDSPARISLVLSTKALPTQLEPYLLFTNNYVGSQITNDHSPFMYVFELTNIISKWRVFATMHRSQPVQSSIKASRWMSSYIVPENKRATLTNRNDNPPQYEGSL